MIVSQGDSINGTLEGGLKWFNLYSVRLQSCMYVTISRTHVILGGNDSLRSRNSEVNPKLEPAFYFQEFRRLDFDAEKWAKGKDMLHVK